MKTNDLLFSSISFRITQKDYSKLKKIAKNLGMTRSELFRSILKDLLAD